MRILLTLTCLLLCASCKKDWVCHCTFDRTYNVNFGISSTTQKNARVVCDSIDNDFKKIFGGCELYSAKKFN